MDLSSHEQGSSREVNERKTQKRKANGDLVTSNCGCTEEAHPNINLTTEDHVGAETQAAFYNLNAKQFITVPDNTTQDNVRIRRNKKNNLYSKQFIQLPGTLSLYNTREERMGVRRPKRHNLYSDQFTNPSGNTHRSSHRPTTGKNVGVTRLIFHSIYSQFMKSVSNKLKAHNKHEDNKRPRRPLRRNLYSKQHLGSESSEEIKHDSSSKKKLPRPTIQPLTSRPSDIIEYENDSYDSNRRIHQPLQSYPSEILQVVERPSHSNTKHDRWDMHPLTSRSSDILHFRTYSASGLRQRDDALSPTVGNGRKGDLTEAENGNPAIRRQLMELMRQREEAINSLTEEQQKMLQETTFDQPGSVLHTQSISPMRLEQSQIMRKLDQFQVKMPRALKPIPESSYNMAAEPITFSELRHKDVKFSGSTNYDLHNHNQLPCNIKRADILPVKPDIIFDQKSSLINIYSSPSVTIFSNQNVKEPRSRKTSSAKRKSRRNRRRQILNNLLPQRFTNRYRLYLTEPSEGYDLDERDSDGVKSTFGLSGKLRRGGDSDHGPWNVTTDFACTCTDKIQQDDIVKPSYRPVVQASLEDRPQCHSDCRCKSCTVYKCFLNKRPRDSSMSAHAWCKEMDCESGRHKPHSERLIKSNEHDESNTSIRNDENSKISEQGERRWMNKWTNTGRGCFPWRKRSKDKEGISKEDVFKPRSSESRSHITYNVEAVESDVTVDEPNADKSGNRNGKNDTNTSQSQTSSKSSGCAGACAGPDARNVNRGQGGAKLSRKQRKAIEKGPAINFPDDTPEVDGSSEGSQTNGSGTKNPVWYQLRGLNSRNWYDGASAYIARYHPGENIKGALPADADALEMIGLGKFMPCIYRRKRAKSRPTTGSSFMKNICEKRSKSEPLTFTYGRIKCPKIIKRIGSSSSSCASISSSISRSTLKSSNRDSKPNVVNIREDKLAPKKNRNDPPSSVTQKKKKIAKKPIKSLMRKLCPCCCKAKPSTEKKPSSVKTAVSGTKVAKSDSVAIAAPVMLSVPSEMAIIRERTPKVFYSHQSESDGDSYVIESRSDKDITRRSTIKPKKQSSDLINEPTPYRAPKQSFDDREVKGRFALCKSCPGVRAVSDVKDLFRIVPHPSVTSVMQADTSGRSTGGPTCKCTKTGDQICRCFAKKESQASNSVSKPAINSTPTKALGEKKSSKKSLGSKKPKSVKVKKGSGSKDKIRSGKGSSRSNSNSTSSKSSKSKRSSKTSVSSKKRKPNKPVAASTGQPTTQAKANTGETKSTQVKAKTGKPTKTAKKPKKKRHLCGCFKMCCGKKKKTKTK